MSDLKKIQNEELENVAGGSCGKPYYRLFCSRGHAATDGLKEEDAQNLLKEKNTYCQFGHLADELVEVTGPIIKRNKK
ncbi:MAG: hypothetical protein Q4E88_01585 [Coriobacteriia bacterium]|nr:hypothetical protein [Coriobacteriia bacterium]